jgi:hypothetical protein
MLGGVLPEHIDSELRWIRRGRKRFVPAVGSRLASGIGASAAHEIEAGKDPHL